MDLWIQIAAICVELLVIIVAVAIAVGRLRESNKSLTQSIDKLSYTVDKLGNGYHDLDKRVSIIENHERTEE